MSDATRPGGLGDYDFRMFDDVSEMRREIVRRDREVGLSRLVAGYAWEWKTKGNKPGHDIEIGELRMRWNSTQTDWIASPGSLDEVGSIHTVQGDLALAKVTNELRWSDIASGAADESDFVAEYRLSARNPVAGTTTGMRDLTVRMSDDLAGRRGR